MVWNLPNTLTWLRIFAIPLVIVFFYLPYGWADPAAGLLFAVAGITDSLDGYLARRMGQTSRLGAFLDPVADKLIVAVALVLLVSKEMPRIIVPGLEGIDGGHATLRPESVRVILVLCSVGLIGRAPHIPARGRARPAGQRGIRSVGVCCGSAPGARPSYSAAAEELGTALAHRGITLVYGGGRLGLMGIVAEAAL